MLCRTERRIVSESPARRRGFYMLIIHLPASARIAVGALGEFLFKKGYYIYVGSAQGGLEQRVSRHLRPDKPLRWHIDYLLEHARVVDTLMFDTTGVRDEQDLRRRLLGMLGGDSRDLKKLPTECLLARSVAAQHGASAPAAGFGSSDCKCDTHLFYLPDPGMLQFTNSTH